MKMKDVILGKVWAQKKSIQCTIPKDFVYDLGIENGNTIVFTKVGNSIVMTKLDLENL
jgi:bifunctional DNA-binding transcriptional regulator/antitoxin component of YhaV-PrlF toxin-antitoxin module